MQSKVVIPQGEKIQLDAKGALMVPDNPIIPFIEGDGIGVDVTPAMRTVIDAAVEKPMAANVKFRGWKSMPVVKQMRSMAKILGYPMKP